MGVVGERAAIREIEGLAVFRIDRLRPLALPPPDVGARLSSLMTRSRRRRAAVDPRLIRGAEMALVIAIGVVLAAIFWAAIGPVSRPSTTPRAVAAPAEPASQGPLDPFRMASAPVADEAATPSEDLAETTLNLVLHGTWVDDKGGAAFIKTPDDKQARYSVGDTVTSGVTLERVYRDQVVINRGGVRESLRLINREQTRPARATPVDPAPIARDQPQFEGVAQIGHLIVAEPSLDEIGNLRLILQPAGDAEAFEKLGLKPGDALVAVDNQPVGPDVASSLETIARLDGKSSVAISVERDGVVLPIEVALPNSARVPND